MAFPTSGGLRAISTQTFTLDPLDSAEYRLRPTSFKQPLSYGSKRTRNQANCSQYFTKAPQMSSNSLHHSRSMIIDKETTKTLKKSIHRAPSTANMGYAHSSTAASSGRQNAQLETHFISCIQKQMEGRLADVSSRHPIQDPDSVGSRYSKAREIRFADDAKFKRSIATLAEDLHYEPQVSQKGSDIGYSTGQDQYYDRLNRYQAHRTPEKQLKRSNSDEQHQEALHDASKGRDGGSKPPEYAPGSGQTHLEGDLEHPDDHREGVDWHQASEMTRYYQRRSKDASKSPQPPSTAAQVDSTVKHSSVSTNGQLNLNRQSVLSRVSWSQSQTQLLHSGHTPLPREFDPQEGGWEFVKVMEDKIDHALRRSRSRIGLQGGLSEFEQGEGSPLQPMHPSHSQSPHQGAKLQQNDGIGIWMPSLTLITPEKDKAIDGDMGSTIGQKLEPGANRGVTPQGFHPGEQGGLREDASQSRRFTQLQGSDENVMILGSPIDQGKYEVPDRYDDPLNSWKGDSRQPLYQTSPLEQHREGAAKTHDTYKGNSADVKSWSQHHPGAENYSNYGQGQQPIQFQGSQSSHSLISTETQGLAFRGLAHDISKRNHFVAKHPEVSGVYAYELNSNFLEEVWSLRFVASQELRVLIADSVIFVGDKKNGVKCGKGKYLTQRGGRILYEGFFYDNLYHGEGRLVNPKLPSGGVRSDWWRDLDSLEHWQQFQGHFSGGYPEGLGTLFISNGDSISGVFLRGRLNGGATLRLASQASKEYFGEWLDNILGSELQ